MKLLVFNVKHSENLGDGLLACCLETALRQCGSDVEVETVDLAGRGEVGTAVRARGYVLALLGRMPAPARRFVVRKVLDRRLRASLPDWNARIAAADAVVIGGGNLFQDDDLNFPLKVGAVLDCVQRQKRPLSIYAVGVSRNWSPEASALFGRLRNLDLVHVSVRDEIARENWMSHFPEGGRPHLVPDPGLLAGSMDLPRPLERCVGNNAGLCVTNPAILRRHSDKSTREIPMLRVRDYCEVMQVLESRGWCITLFCNGAREDAAFLEAILAVPAVRKMMASGVVQVAPRPKTARELLSTIDAFDAMAAHRLHACIAAYALGVPVVGLGWDSKVEGFFRSTHREAFLVTDRSTSSEEIAGLIDQVATHAVDPVELRATVAKAREGVARLHADLSAFLNAGSVVS